MSTGSSQLDVAASRRRGWGRLWQAPLFALGLLTLIVVGVTAPLRNNPARDFQRDLRQLRYALYEEERRKDAGHVGDELTNLQPLVDSLRESAENHPKHQAECSFLVGSYYSLLGERDNDLDWLDRASAFLSKSLTQGIAETDMPMLLYRLGMVQYRQGKHLGQALNWVRQGLDLGADHPARGYAFLVEAYLGMPQPNLVAALSASQKSLEHADTRDAEAMGKARYLHADILQRMEHRAEALRELEQIDDAVSPPLLAKVRLLQAICSDAEEQWSSALSFWRALEPIADHVPGGQARVLYQTGVAHTKLDPPDFAAAEALWRRAAASPSTDAAVQAASLRLGHALLVGPRYEPDEALKIWTAALANIRASSDYKNLYLELPEVLNLFDQACLQFLEKRDFVRSQATTALLSKIAPPGAAEERIGQTYLRWARDLMKRAEQSGDASEELLREARARSQDAGDYFKQATLSREPADKIDLTWQSSMCYLLAGDHANAAVVLESYVTLTQGDARRAQGYFALAETYQALGQKVKSREHYLKCVEINTPPFTSRALSKMAQGEIETKNLTRAREILTQILNGNATELERDLQEQTIYQLGQLLFDLGEADEAAVRLREALRQFPKNAKAMTVRDRLAIHAWEQAKKIAVVDPRNVPADRRALAESMQQKRRSYLQEALESYQALDRDYEVRHRDNRLAMDDLLLWRKALFGIGDLKMEMGEYPEAMLYFRDLQLRYAKRAESLFAADKAYLCWRQIVRMPEERPAFHQMALEVQQMALRDLEAMPRDREYEEKVFHAADARSRDQWRDFFIRWETELSRVTSRVDPRTLAPN